MGLRARYDADEDRILLTFETADDVVQLWMTRRLWIGILKALLGVSEKMVGAQYVRPVKPGKAQHPVPAAPSHPPEVPLAVRVRSAGNSAKLIFERRDAPHLLFNCTSEEIPAVIAFFRERAELVGWDSDAALARIGRPHRQIRKASLH